MKNEVDQIELNKRLSQADMNFAVSQLAGENLKLEVNEVDDAEYEAEVSAEDEAKQLKMVSEWCQEAEQLSGEIQILEEQLKERKEELDGLLKGRIPEALESIGLKELKLTSGKKITVIDDCQVSISKERHGAAMQWLREGEFDDIIKNNVTVAFSKGQDETAMKLFRELLSKGMDVSHKEAVHPATLKAFIKEQIKGGNLSTADKELFGVYEYKLAKLK